MNVKHANYGLPLILILFLLIPVAAQFPVINQEDKFDKELETINNLSRVGDFERALSYLDYLRKSYGNHPELTFMYKKVYMDAKMYPDLEGLIAGQLALAPDDELLLAELGNVRFLRDDAHGADSLWDLAMSRAGANSGAFIYVAGYKLQYGDYYGATEAYLKGRSALGSPVIFAAELANVYESQRKYADAVRELLLYLSLAPARLNMISSKIGGFLKDTDNVDEIVEAVVRGAAAYPDRKEIIELLGEVYIKLNRMDKALETYGRLGKGRKDDGASFCLLAERCYENQAYTTAIEAANQYLKTTKQGSQREKALLIKGKSERQAGLIENAIVTLSSLSGSARNRKFGDEASLLLGLIYASDIGDCAAAIHVWQGLADQKNVSEEGSIATVEMAACYLRLDQFALAESILTDLLKIQGDMAVNQKALFILGDLAFIAGDYEKAKELYERLAGGDPTDDFANDALERLSILSATDFDAISSSGLDRFAGGLRELAMGRLTEAAVIFSDSAFDKTSLSQTAVFYAAVIYEEAGDQAQAVQLYQNYIEAFPDGSFIDRAHLGLGDLYMRDIDTYPLARLAFNAILRDFPDGPIVEQARERLKRLETANKIG